MAGPAFSRADFTSEYSANVSLFRPQSYGSGSVSNAVIIRNTTNIVGPGGPVVTVVESQLTRGMILRGAARLIPYVGAAALVKDVYDAYRVKPQADGAILYDEGEQKRTFSDYWCVDTGVGNVRQYGGSPGGACDAWVQKANSGGGLGPVQACSGGGGYQVKTTLSLGACNGPNTCDLVVTNAPQRGPFCVGDTEPSSTYTLSNALVTGTENRLRCEFGSASPVDGKCPRGEGGTYDGNMTGPQLQDKGDLPPLDYPDLDDKLPGILADAAGRATDTVPFPVPANAPSRVPYEGNVVPAFVPGGVTRTQHSDGTVTETATGWNIRPNNNFSTPGQVKWGTTTTTTKKDSQGNVTSTETTSTEPEPGTDEKDSCTANPDRVGCLKTGTVEDLELEKVDKAVTFTPDAGWGGGGECPSPPSFEVLGYQLEFDNSGFCLGLLILKGIFLTFCALVSAAIIMEGFKA
jgi:hypothetical protein